MAQQRLQLTVIVESHTVHYWDNAPRIAGLTASRASGYIARVETRVEMTAASFEHIGVFYNRERCQLTLGYLSLVQFLKNRFRAQQRKALVA